MKDRVISIIPIVITIFLTSAIWFLATVDGTIEAIHLHLTTHAEIKRLEQHRDRLKIETEILELELKRKVYRVQLQYAENRGF